VLLQQVRRNKTSFDAMIFWRVFQEIGVWLAKVEHQIWLLRNVLWRYLLPPGVAILAFIMASVPNNSNASDTAHRPSAPEDDAVANLLVAIREKHDVPAISAMLLSSEGITAAGVAGVRKRGSEVPATSNDLWHLGSVTKAMTATLVARMVEQGQVAWDTTVAQVFPEFADTFHPEMRGVTLIQLLSHRAGLPTNLNLRDYLGRDGQEERLRAVRNELAKPPRHQPGKEYEYSNLGYIIAGAVIEKIAGRNFEDAAREELFLPLGMTSAGFGGLGAPGQIDQPWPHASDGQPMPENGPAMDNPPVMSPAGRAHCTLEDWAKFVQDQLRGARGELALLKPASYQKLHTPPFGGDYALGWIVVQRDWAGGKALNHGGDNTMNFANVWIAPARDFAILACVNQGGDRAFAATDEAVAELIRLNSAE
jgi:CubicO group peptidase (beta-lactamase class C family)